jgi:hypothetical protein
MTKNKQQIKRPSKAKQAQLRVAVADTIGDLDWLWQTPSQQSSQGNPIDYRARRYALAALSAATLLFLAALSNVIPFDALLTL